MNVDSEELNEEESGQSDKGDEHGESVTESLCYGTGNLETEDVSYLHSARQTSLPSSSDLVCAGFRVESSILLREGRLCPELTLLCTQACQLVFHIMSRSAYQQDGVVTFHDNGGTEDY